MAELTTEKFEQSMESFAKIVKEGFDAVDRRFDAVDRRFDALEFAVRSNHEEMRHEIARVDDRIDKLTAAVDGFMQLHQKLDIELVALRQKYEILAARVARLEGVPA